jgi:transcription elongation factor GreB
VSKAFTKDETYDEPVVAARAPLPDGTPNWVTPRGLRLLRAELERLEAERAAASATTSDDDERQRRLAILGQRQADLAERISGARVVDPASVDIERVRFATCVVIRTVEGADEGRERRIAIVGVDEADPASGRIAFTAPLARALVGAEVGDEVTLETARGDELLEVLAIERVAE